VAEKSNQEHNWNKMHTEEITHNFLLLCIFEKREKLGKNLL